MKDNRRCISLVLVLITSCVGSVTQDPEGPGAVPDRGVSQENGPQTPPVAGPAGVSPAAPGTPAGEVRPVGVIGTPRAFETDTVDTYPLLRLSRSQYAHMIEDVLGNATPPLDDLVKIEPASQSGNSKDLFDGFQMTAFAVAERAVGPGGKLEKYCGSDAATCGRKFVAEFAPLLFRRPLDADEGPQWEKGV